jgi:hypothetical protein
MTLELGWIGNSNYILTNCRMNKKSCKPYYQFDFEIKRYPTKHLQKYIHSIIVKHLNNVECIAFRCLSALSVVYKPSWVSLA